MSEKDRPLNIKQKRFVREYMKDFNGKQAAIRAGYSANTANVQAAQLLAKLNVRHYMEQLESGEIANWSVNKEDIVQRWVDLAINTKQVEIMKKFEIHKENLEDFYNSLNENEALLIKKVTTSFSKDWGREYNLEMYDQHRCLEVLSKHLGVYREVGNEGNNISLEKLIVEALSKEKKGKDDTQD